MNWYDAIDAYEKLGNGWRLPTLEELKAMYEELHKKGQGNFQDGWYWSSSENDLNLAWDLGFHSGIASSGHDKGNTNYVRAIRAL